jgi:hypothetical protein
VAYAIGTAITFINQNAAGVLRLRLRLTFMAGAGTTEIDAGGQWGGHGGEGDDDGVDCFRYGVMNVRTDAAGIVSGSGCCVVDYSF